MGWLAANWLLAAAGLACSALAGRALLSAGRRGALPRWQAWLAPAVGLSAFTHLAALAGWFAGFPAVPIRMVSAAVLAVVAYRERRRIKLWLADLGPWALAALGGGMALWCQMALYGTFDPYNDAFTYLSHSQWLQANPYADRIREAVWQPALSQVRWYQTLELRMGASFLLAWLQSVSGAAFAHQVYPAVMALAAGSGALALGGALWSLAGSQRWLALAAGLLPAVALSGVSFAVTHAFLPQSFGLAFGLAALVLTAAENRPSLGAALCWSATVYTYREALPFLAAGCLAILLLRRRDWKVIAATLAMALLLVAPEAAPAWRSIRRQASEIVGINAPFSGAEALGHAFSLHSGLRNDRIYLGLGPWLTLPLLPAAAILAAYGYRGRRRRLAQAVALAVTAVTLLAAWAWFRYGERNPWDGTPGNPWRQERASGWATYPAMFLLCGGLVLAAGRNRTARSLVWTTVIVWLSAGAVRHALFADRRTGAVRAESLSPRDCLEGYVALRSKVLATTGGSPVWLEGRGWTQAKHRQMAAYTLWDLPVGADWSGDDYIGARLSASGATPNPRDAAWILAPNLELAPADTRALLIDDGPYPAQVDSGGRFRWTDSELRCDFRFLRGGPAAQIRVSFHAGAVSPRAVEVLLNGRSAGRIDLTGAAVEGQLVIAMPAGEEGTLLFRSDAPPENVEWSGSGRRRQSFYLRNLRIERLN